MDPADVVRASSLAELAWVGPDGTPRVAGVVALTRGEVPAVALTYARADLARALAAEGPRGERNEVALCLTEPRSTGREFRPVALLARPRLVEDPDGSVYLADLVVQELHRYPPARVLADSPLLCRENWWYLPRLVVELPEPGTVPLAPRGTPADHLLVTVDGDRPVVTVVRAAAPPTATAEPVALQPLGGQDPRPGPAALFAQDASFPDLERWDQWVWRGRLDGEAGGVRLLVDQRPARVGLQPTQGVLGRWRAQRQLERDCRVGFRRWRDGETP